MLPKDLPEDLPSFVGRFGTDAQCRAYLFGARWPEGFRGARCRHDRAWAHKARLIYECAACGRQHSLLKGTIFEQTKTGLAKWFLAIFLVSASKGGISAMALKRQMGFGSYQTAWSWLHKIRRAMVRPDREPLTERVEVDETCGWPTAWQAGARCRRQSDRRWRRRERPRQGQGAAAGAAQAGRSARRLDPEPRGLPRRRDRQASAGLD